MTEIVQVKGKAPLPATVSDLVSRKTMQPRRTLNDYVDDIHLSLWEKNRDYMRLLDAVSDEDAVEGSLSIDNAKAAEIIRDHAVKNGVNYVAEKKLATIVRSLNVVLRRYHMTRKERAYLIGGETVLAAE